jgi:hypothetical protein
METADERRGKEAVRVDKDVVAASEVRRLEERIRKLERRPQERPLCCSVRLESMLIKDQRITSAANVTTLSRRSLQLKEPGLVRARETT